MLGAATDSRLQEPMLSFPRPKLPHRRHSGHGSPELAPGDAFGLLEVTHRPACGVGERGQRCRGGAFDNDWSITHPEQEGSNFAGNAPRPNACNRR